MAEKKLHKVQYRGGFSDRNGINKISTQIQLKNFDKRTRTAICNLFYELISGQVYIEKDESIFFNDYECEYFFERLISEVYCEPLSDFIFNRIYKTELYKEYVEPIIMDANYADILSMLEFLYSFSIYYDAADGQYTPYSRTVGNLINDIFEKEYVGYRLIDGKAVPISDESEQKEIETTLEAPFEGCRTHIHKALGFLSDREKPDYKNCVKESISAIEAACKVILGNDSVDLNGAIKKLKDKGIKLHPALSQAIEKLYAYAGDKGGVRHSEKSVESNLSFEEAKLILVTSCALVNFLIAEYGKLNEKQRN